MLGRKGEGGIESLNGGAAHAEHERMRGALRVMGWWW
jgi:hypothetical protein